MAIPKSGPLADIRVLDLATGLAGPFCAKMLGDLGATVVKIEAPEGDPSRRCLPQVAKNTSSAYFFGNSSKQSAVLDLDNPATKSVIAELVRQHDIVVTSLTESQLAHASLDWYSVQSLNPAAILVSITPFGSTGPYSEWRSTSLITNALGGWANTCGEESREPLIAGRNLAEYVAGGYATAATLAAVVQRDADGLGQFIDVSAMEAAITAALLPTLVYEFSGAVPIRNSTRATGPSWIMKCKDGYVGSNILTPLQWTALCEMLGATDLLESQEYANPQSRMSHERELRARFAPWFEARTAEEVFHEGQAWRLPFGLVPSFTDILEFDQHKTREFFIEMQHPDGSGRNVLFPRLPFQMSKTPSDPKPPPAQGEHTREVLMSLLGLSDSEINDLAEAGVLGPLGGNNVSTI